MRAATRPLAPRAAQSRGWGPPDEDVAPADDSNSNGAARSPKTAKSTPRGIKSKRKLRNPHQKGVKRKERPRADGKVCAEAEGRLAVVGMCMLQTHGAAATLSAQIESFASRVQNAADAEQAAVVAPTISALQTAARGAGVSGSASIALFGSRANGLALPGADVDAAVLNAGVTSSRGGGGYSSKQKAEAVTTLNRLARRLRADRVAKSLQLISKARVPVIKAVFQSGVAVDVSVGSANGVEAVGAVRKLVDDEPLLAPLVLVLKAFLRERGMNEAFNGGISSYVLTLMVACHLRMSRRGAKAAAADGSEGRAAHAQEAETGGDVVASTSGSSGGADGGADGGSQPEAAGPLSLGVLLATFLERFGGHSSGASNPTFSFEDEAISLQAGGKRLKRGLVDFSDPRRRPNMLAAEDPQEAGRDIGVSAHDHKRWRAAFRSASEELGRAARGGAGSVACGNAAAADASGLPADRAEPGTLLSAVLEKGGYQPRKGMGRAPKPLNNTKKARRQAKKELNRATKKAKKFEKKQAALAIRTDAILGGATDAISKKPLKHFRGMLRGSTALPAATANSLDFTGGCDFVDLTGSDGLPADDFFA